MRQVVRAGDGARLSGDEMRAIAERVLSRLQIKLEPGALHLTPHWLIALFLSSHSTCSFLKA